MKKGECCCIYIWTYNVIFNRIRIITFKKVNRHETPSSCHNIYFRVMTSILSCNVKNYLENPSTWYFSSKIFQCNAQGNTRDRPFNFRNGHVFLLGQNTFLCCTQESSYFGFIFSWTKISLFQIVPIFSLKTAGSEFLFLSDFFFRTIYLF